MLWNLFQQTQISKSQGAADSANLKASIAASKVEYLEGQVQTLSLACQAMWELVSKSNGLTEKDLLNKMTEIDLRDGALDGKLSTETISQCPDCGHKMKKSRPNCYWCGAKLTTSTPFIK